jgi:hypothetical protein
LPGTNNTALSFGSWGIIHAAILILSMRAGKETDSKGTLYLAGVSNPKTRLGFKRINAAIVEIPNYRTKTRHKPIPIRQKSRRNRLFLAGFIRSMN